MFNQGGNAYGNAYGNMQYNNNALLSQDDTGQQQNGYAAPRAPQSNRSQGVIPVTLQTCTLLSTFNSLWSLDFDSQPIVKVCGIVRKCQAENVETRFTLDDGSAIFNITYHSQGVEQLDPPPLHTPCIAFGNIRRFGDSFYLSALKYKLCTPSEFAMHLLDCAYNHLRRVQTGATPPISNCVVDFPNKPANVNNVNNGSSMQSDGNLFGEKRSTPSGGFGMDPPNKIPNINHFNEFNQQQPNTPQQTNPFLNSAKTSQPYNNNNNNNNHYNSHVQAPNNNTGYNNGNPYQQNNGNMNPYGNQNKIDQQQNNNFNTYNNNNPNNMNNHNYQNNHNDNFSKNQPINPSNMGAWNMNKNNMNNNNNYNNNNQNLSTDFDAVVSHIQMTFRSSSVSKKELCDELISAKIAGGFDSALNLMERLCEVDVRIYEDGDFYILEGLQ